MSQPLPIDVITRELLAGLSACALIGIRHDGTQVLATCARSSAEKTGLGHLMMQMIDINTELEIISSMTRIDPLNPTDNKLKIVKKDDV